MPASLGVRSLNYGAPVNGAAPLNRGLLAWWQVLPQRLGGSTLQDLTGRFPIALTGLGASSATQGWGATRRPGGYGELRLNNDGGTVQGSAGPMLPLNSAPALTLAGWATQTTLNVREYLWTKYTSATVEWLLYTWTDAFFYVEFTSSIYTGFEYVSGVTAGGWYHLAVVFQGSGATNPDRIKIYVNGQPKSLIFAGTIPAVWPNVGTQPVLLGRHAGASTFPWHGAVDDWRIWLRALSASEVMELYTTSRQGSPQQLNWLAWPPGWAGAVAAAPGAGIVRQMMQHAA